MKSAARWMSVGRIEGSGCGTMEIGRSRDRIGELPDAILHHMFSFLPTRQLVEASILSKRWTHLWESTPTLSFSSDDFDSTMDGRRRFTNFIDTVLLLRDASDISTFRLQWMGEGKDLEKAERWLRFVVKRNVKWLELQMHLYIDEILPSCVFNCQSLQVLKLEVMCGFIGLPGPVSLPKLKRLEVSYAEFLDDSLKDLLSGCPLLEVLSFEHCYFFSLEICSPELKRLQLYVPDDAETVVRISAPKLVSFTYWGMVFQELALMNLSSLAHASVCLFFNSLNDDIGDTDRYRRISSVLAGLHNVESLEFLCGAFKFFLQRRDRSQSLPLFRNLKHLRAGISLDKDGIAAITSLLHCSPNLESLVIDQYKVPQNSSCMEGESMATMPDSARLCHLRVVEISNFGATEHELSFVKLLSGDIFSAEKVTLVPSKKTQNRVTLHEDGSSSTIIQHEEIQGSPTSSSLLHARLQ